MQSASEYMIRVADYERECHSRAQIALQSCEITKMAISKALKRIAFDISRKPGITKKEARAARKRDFQTNKAPVIVNQDGPMLLLDAVPTVIEEHTAITAIVTRKNSYLAESSNLKSTCALIAVQLHLDIMSPIGSIRTIDISGQGLGDKQIMELLNQLQGSSVMELSLASNKISDESLFRLSMVLPSLVNLTNLNLSVNNFKDNGVQALCSPNVFPVSLKHIDLSRNSLGLISAYYIGSLFAAADDAVISDAKSQLNITGLFIGGNKIQGHSVDFIRILMSFLCRNRAPMGLMSLSLPAAGLETDGLAAVAAYIACSKSITFMNISNNAFIDEKTKRLYRETLLANRSLKHISIGKCNLTATERGRLQQYRSLTSNLSWRDKTRLSIQVGREFNKCTKARHAIEVAEFNMWSREKPLEWPDNIYLSGENPAAPSLKVPKEVINIPKDILYSVKHVNEAISALSYLEQVLLQCNADEQIAADNDDSIPRGPKFAISSREYRLRKDKLGEAKLLLVDYGRGSITGGTVDREIMNMVLEDLLATLILQETSVAISIASAYMRRLQRKERTARDEAFSRRVSTGGTASRRTSLQYGASKRGSITPLTPPPPPRISEHDIPYYGYLGDAAVFIYYLYVVRPFEHELKAREVIKKGREQLKKRRHKAGGSDKSESTANTRGGSLSGVGSMPVSGITTTVASRMSVTGQCVSPYLDGTEPIPFADQVQSALLEAEDADDGIDNIGGRRDSGLSTGTTGSIPRQTFAEMDADLFRRLSRLDLSPEEGDRAVISNSRSNQRNIVFDFTSISLPIPPDLEDVCQPDLMSLILEEDCPRSTEIMMDLHAVDTTHRTIARMEHLRESAANRLSRRKASIL